MITVLDGGKLHSFSYDEMEKYHGPLAPGGIAFACKLMQLAFPLFSPNGPVERRALAVETSFPGLGVRDAFEMVTRCVSREAYRFDLSVGDAFEDRGAMRGFVFRLTYHDQSLTLILRDGIMRQAFLDMVAKGKGRSGDDEIQFMWLKQDLGRRVMQLHESAVFEVVAA